MNIKTVSIKSVKPYWRNPRNNKETVEALKLSIERYGFRVPITVDKEGVIVTGHARYKAMLELGREELPVIVLDLSPELIREYRLADNKVTEHSRWDSNKLGEELSKLSDLSIMENFGFQSFELQQFENFTMQPLDEAAGNAKSAFSSDGKGNVPQPYPCPNCGHEHFYDAEKLKELKEAQS